MQRFRVSHSAWKFSGATEQHVLTAACNMLWIHLESSKSLASSENPARTYSILLIPPPTVLQLEIVRRPGLLNVLDIDFVGFCWYFRGLCCIIWSNSYTLDKIGHVREVAEVAGKLPTMAQQNNKIRTSKVQWRCLTLELFGQIVGRHYSPDFPGTPGDLLVDPHEMLYHSAPAICGSSFHKMMLPIFNLRQFLGKLAWVPRKGLFCLCQRFMDLESFHATSSQRCSSESGGA